MDIEEKEKLARHKDTSSVAISARLVAARKATGYKQKEMAAAMEISGTTYNSQETKGRPSIATMKFLYRNHRVDFNFILYGDFLQLPGDVQDSLFDFLSADSQV